MITITVAQRKGGNGKSTATLNLAACFAESGRRVVVIDLDDQQNSSSAIGGAEGQYTVADLLVGSGDRRLDEVCVPTAWSGVDLVAASGSLSGVIRELDGEVAGYQVLAETLAGDYGYDICMIDTSPALNILTLSALVASDYLFIPLASHVFSSLGLVQTLEAFRKVQKRLNAQLQLAGAAFVVHDKRSRLAVEVVRRVREAYGELILATEIGRAIAIEEAQRHKQSILQYAPRSRGAAQYRALSCELEARIEASDGQ